MGVLAACIKKNTSTSNPGVDHISYYYHYNTDSLHPGIYAVTLKNATCLQYYDTTFQVYTALKVYYKPAHDSAWKMGFDRIVTGGSASTRQKTITVQTSVKVVNYDFKIVVNTPN
jgi:hypothetical protein